ncbi:maltose transporter membrane protein [Escherichia coli]|uniref:Maltose/maltodextrin transport system permease protein n=1 Tax=Escherichia coli TaxID=562 RepID=A0A376VS55_ECOLX|nr:maltose transporter membrane protein [Escherichia coli]
MITQNRQALSDITAILPDGNKVMMSSLRQFSGTQPLYTLDGDGTLTNNQSGVKYRPNNQIGFYQSITADGNWGDEKLSPGYTVTTGWKNFTRVFTDEGIQKPFLAIFRLDRGVLADHRFFNGGGRHGSGVSGAVGSVARQSGLSRPADSALRGAIVHFNLDFQRVV